MSSSLTENSPSSTRVVTVVGILNVTPDSFSDGGRYFDPSIAVAKGLELFSDGAQIVDVGGESTRPGATPISIEEEIRRVVPVIEELSRYGRVSIDTFKAEVAVAAIAAGASQINDISSTLFDVAAQYGVGWVAMHMKGTPTNMQKNPTYEDVVDEVLSYLDKKVAIARRLGIEEIYVDPGIGFGKTMDHNLQLLAALPRFTNLGAPVYIGTSRKGFLGKLIGEVEGVDAAPTDRIEGNLATVAWSISNGVSALRVHDVKETCDYISLAGLA
ncbi:MAG: dihydropteroate synthase [Actinomycetota bacterium]|nr:dihydropteroate synthase [Actinomycetota bacterium]